MTSAKVHRENVPVTEDEQALLSLLTQDTLERRVLTELAGEYGTSRAAAAHAVLSLGIEVVRGGIQEHLYLAYRDSMTEEDEREQREIARTRRERNSDRWSKE
ncbi:hypothetical protein ACFQ1S_16695 [Kibdelosporangium lantanae]|uniref:MarR family transcriptional regulator n=1 Tax=Kibdelosporangium lantanae TaxID=1497396 RepID=A0ABW3M9M9_9PSEU